MSSLLRRSLAEAVGTFSFVFIGCASIASRYFNEANYGLLGIAIAHAIALSIMITATMSISGGHLNPAVTVGLLVARRTTGRTAAAYIAAQLVGAVVAAALLRILWPVNLTRSISLGTPAIAGNILVPQAIGIEAVLTFFLVSAVFGTCVNPTAPKVGGFGVGLVLLFDILVSGNLTGAAMNPARAFGPAVVSGQWVGQGVYWVGPILGGIIAALVWEYVLLKGSEK
ncbi:MAG TPA: aquaporin [Gemmatimonadales bacterium]|jgi:aquaporin Z